MAFTGGLTAEGSAMVAQWVQGSTINITRAAAGTTVGQTPTTQALSIVSQTAVTGGYRFGLQFDNSELTAGYVARVIGLWATLNGGTETLIATFSDSATPGGINIPASSETKDFSYIFYAGILLSGSGTLTVTVDPTAYVSYTEYNNHVNNSTNAHGMGAAARLNTETTLTDNNNFIPTSHAVYAALENFSIIEYGATAPTNTKKLWDDPDTTNGGLKRYNGSAWVHVGVAYKN